MYLLIFIQNIVLVIQMKEPEKFFVLIFKICLILAQKTLNLLISGLAQVATKLKWVTKPQVSIKWREIQIEVLDMAILL